MRIVLLLAPIALLLAQSPKLPLENESVRVVLAEDKPVAQPGRQHEHKQNRVMIYLDPGDIQIKYADGKVDNQHWKAGDVAWSPAGGLHTSQNVSSKTVRIVEIELKNAGKADAGNTDKSALIDNAQVRVTRGNKAPKGNYVAVDEKNAIALWNQMPAGPGPFVIAEIK